MVNINLLPFREKKLDWHMLVYVVIAVIWLVTALGLAYMHYSTVQEKAVLKEQLVQKEKMLANEKEKKQAPQPSVAWQQYAALSDAVRELFYPPTIMLNELTINLPANSRLVQAKYELNGKITVQGYFEKYEDIAAYLTHLQKSAHVSSASVKKINALPITIKWNGKEVEHSPASQAVGGRILPRYAAEFELQAITMKQEKAVQKKE